MAGEGNTNDLPEQKEEESDTKKTKVAPQPPMKEGDAPAGNPMELANAQAQQLLALTQLSQAPNFMALLGQMPATGLGGLTALPPAVPSNTVPEAQLQRRWS